MNLPAAPALRRRKLAVVLAGIAVLCASGPAALQDPPTRETLEKWIEHARAGSPAVRPQAAQRLVRAGAPAAELLLERASAEGGGIAELGPDLVEVLGAFGSPALRARQLEALAEPDFPWRPAAARGYAAQVTPEERDRLPALLGDPLAAVRAAALDAVRALEARDQGPAVAALLEDPDDRVRRLAACLLSDWGDRSKLAWLRADLSRSDTFFDRPTGTTARYDAWRLLRPRLADPPPFDPGLDPAAPEALAQCDRLAESLPETLAVELPPVARPAGALPECPLGLELRSCRRGELVLRWSSDDELFVGLGNPARLALPEGSSARLLERARKAFASLGEQRFFGAPGCDLEDYLWQDPAADAGRAQVFRISKGPAAVAGLRPAPLGELAAEIVASLPEDARDDPRTKDLKRRVRETLAALGGEL